MGKRFNVVFTGEIREGHTIDDTRKSLLALYKGNTASVDKLLNAKRAIIRKEVDLDTAKKYKAAFDKTGALCELVEIVNQEPKLEMEPAERSIEQATSDSQTTPAETSTNDHEKPSKSIFDRYVADPDDVTQQLNENPCAECGKRFPQDEMIPYHDKWICANCKPVFIQKMKEGVGVSTDLAYAGFWIRFGAKFLDGLILGAVNMAINFVFMGVIMQNPGETGSAAFAGTMILVALQIPVNAFYNIFFLGKFAATPGKMLCRLKVVTPDGGKVSYGRATGRFFGEFVSGIILYIGYLMVAFDDEKRALHDRMCGTRVIKIAK